MTPFTGTNRVTSPYGYREYWNKGRLVQETHRGIDVVCTAFSGQAVAQTAWTVREVTGGRVLRIACDAQRGNYVDVETQPGTFERYQHLARVDVRVGQAVAQGAVLGLGGSTGNSTGAHLHFGVYRGGCKEANAVEPSAWLGLANRVGVYEGNDAVDSAGSAGTSNAGSAGHADDADNGAGSAGGTGSAGGVNDAGSLGDAGNAGGTNGAGNTSGAGDLFSKDLAVCRVGPASAGDRAALAALAARLCLPYAETAV